MNRRHFLLNTAGAISVAALGLPVVSRAAGSPVSAETEALIRELVATNDNRVAMLLARQDNRTGHRDAGGLPNEHGLYTAHDTAGFIVALICAIAAPGSKHHQSAALVPPLERAAAHLLRCQHEDGTIDLVTTNFKSPPDTAFVLEGLTSAATLLRRLDLPAHERLRTDLRTFIVRAGGALADGGVHTPNHRWVVCGALAKVHALYPDDRYVRRIDSWLAEGIDLDPDGQYTEKSTSVYSPVVDRALLTVARLLDRPDLREPVRKNLEMTLYYVHPDGEVVTEASKRQDKYQRGSMGRYYYSYRTLAVLDANGRFAAMARQIERTARPQLLSELPSFLEEAELRAGMPADATLPTDYARVFPYSNLARIRRGSVSATVLAENTTLFSLRKGGAALEAVRIASAFFGKGQFSSPKLEVSGNRYRLSQELDGPYFQPLSDAQIADGEHVRMAPNGTLAPGSRSARAISNVQRLESVAEIVEEGGRFTLEISIHGTAGVPVAVELAFRHGGNLEGVQPLPDVKDGCLLAGEQGRYRVGDDVIAFGPGRMEHTWTQLRGALPKWDGQSVYVTGLTPFRTTLTFS